MSVKLELVGGDNAATIRKAILAEAEEFMQGADKLMIVIQRNDRQIEILYDFGSRDDHIAMLNHALFHILSNQVFYEES